MATPEDIEAGARALAVFYGLDWECCCTSQKGLACDCGDALYEDREGYDERPSRNDLRDAVRAVLNAVDVGG